MAKGKILIVNEQDEVIGAKERGTLIDDVDIYRVAALWIQNSKGDMLLAQRAFTKKNDPGKWGPAVAGTVEEGETYESNILKEAEEEIGLTNAKLEISEKRLRLGKHKHFTQWFFAIVDKDISEFTKQDEEVEQIKWFSKEELQKELANNPDQFLGAVKVCAEVFAQGNVEE